MTRRLIVSPKIRSDIEDIIFWYDEQRRGLGNRFLADLRSLLERITEAPGQFPLIERDARRALLHEFPYFVYFRLEGESVVIFAVVHQSRHPESWRTR